MISKDASKIMLYYKKFFKNNFKIGSGIKTKRILDLIPDNDREAVLKELCEDLQYLSFDKNFPDQLRLTKEGYNYIINLK